MSLNTGIIALSLHTQLKQYQTRINSYLESSLISADLKTQLNAAMHYSLFNGGKRIRPILVYMVNQLTGGKTEQADSAAAAIECIHSYSLVHDDLPAMDNDDLRRGKPTCHIAFNEATAILAGDALQTFAFELLAQDNSLTAITRLRLIQKLAHASGHLGMVTGQAFDLNNVGKQLSLSELEQMHAYKTGALLSCAVTMGAELGQADEAEKEQLQRYAQAIGLAFQVQDDLLDIEGDTITIGKPQGSDLKQNKPTYPALLGLEQTKQKLKLLHQEALSSLANFGKEADSLRQLADYVVERDY